MVEKTTPKASRGRPRQFDTDQVIDAAIGAFMAKGFESTTLADIEAATGIDRSTLYNSFGGKQGLYHKATDRYLDRAAESLFQPLQRGSDDGLADIIEFLEHLRSGLASSDVSPGCLIVNDMAARSDPEAARRYRDLLETSLRAALDRAAGGGAVDPSRVDDRAVLISATIIGINLIGRHAGDDQQVNQLIDAAVAEVASWRRSP